MCALTNFLILTVIIFYFGVRIIVSGKDSDYMWRGGLKYEPVTFQGKHTLYIGLAYTVWGGGFSIVNLYSIISGEEGSNCAFMIFIMGVVSIAIMRQLFYSSSDKPKAR